MATFLSFKKTQKGMASLFKKQRKRVDAIQDAKSKEIQEQELHEYKWLLVNYSLNMNAEMIAIRNNALWLLGIIEHNELMDSSTVINSEGTTYGEYAASIREHIKELSNMITQMSPDMRHNLPSKSK